MPVRGKAAAWPLASLVAALGLAAWASRLAWSDQNGTPLFWIAAIGAGALFASWPWSRPAVGAGRGPRIAGTTVRSDLVALGAMLAAFLPVYFLSIYQFPYRINADEIIFVHVQREILKAKPLHLLGLCSFYYYHPNFIFVFEAWLARLFGPLDLTSMRCVAAGFGLLSLAAAFAFFRLLLPRWQAVGACLVIGLCHSLIVLSRMSMWNNTALFVVIGALALLAWARRRDSLGLAYAGGVLAGFSFYTYSAARMIFPIWGLCWLVEWSFSTTFAARRRLAAHGAIAVLGTVLTVSPIVVATLKVGRAAADYSKHQFLIYPEGRDDQKRWTYLSSTKQAVLKNIRYALGTYNNRMWDMGNTYPNQNYDHTGFVDPITGALLWIGLAAALLGWTRTQDRRLEIGLAAAFLFCWLVFAFLVNKAPSYPRLLVTLPMVGYFAIQGLDLAARWFSRAGRLVLGRGRPSEAFLWIVVFAFIAFWNAWIFAYVNNRGMDEGDTWGGTGRYIRPRQQLPRYTYYVVGDEKRPYYYWGFYFWQPWTQFFVKPTETTLVIAPEAVSSVTAAPPFTLFMNETVWAAVRPAVEQRYPLYHVYPITPDGVHLAIETENGSRRAAGGGAGAPPPGPGAVK